MRHFLELSLTKVMLTSGMLQATGEGFLKALACGTLALTTSRTPARLGAIPLPMVAALADAQLLVAPGTVEHSVADLGDGSTSSSQKPGQGPSIASLSARDKNTSGRWMGTSQKARGCHLGPSPFSEPGFPIAPRPRAKPTPSAMRAPRPGPAEKYNEETKPDPRRRWIPNWLTHR
jgi:hypothetical protein